MALVSRTCWRRIQNISRTVCYAPQQKNHVLRRDCLAKIASRLSSGNVGGNRAGHQTSSPNSDPTSIFFKDEVQSCLLEMNMRDISKVFQTRKEGKGLSDVEIKFMTQEQLEEEENKAVETAKYFLQVPPVLSPREDSIIELSKDPALQGLDESKIIFTDISYGVPHRERLVVARDPDGTLRHASTDERYRMLQTYFPDEGRSYEVPQLFSPSNLKSLWERSEFTFILDRACVQFEPDDPHYISITSETYNFIDENCGYDHLLGTRHYGAFAFYLAFYGRLDKFLNHCISTYRIQDAVSIVKIFYWSRPHIRPSKEATSPDDAEFLKEYISEHSKDKALLSKTLSAYLELNLPTAAEEAALGK